MERLKEKNTGGTFEGNTKKTSGNGKQGIIIEDKWKEAVRWWRRWKSKRGSNINFEGNKERDNKRSQKGTGRKIRSSK